MECWGVRGKGALEALQLPVPAITRPKDVLVRVHAASLNPLDTMMIGK